MKHIFHKENAEEVRSPGKKKSWRADHFKEINVERNGEVFNTKKEAEPKAIRSVEEYVWGNRYR